LIVDLHKIFGEYVFWPAKNESTVCFSIKNLNSQ
jgi:hypothetical protein